MTKKLISIVVPVFNEDESLEPLYAELCAMAEQFDYELDVVFVDDGSSDDSWHVIGGLAEKDDRVRAIRLRRNFGKAAALSAGFSVVRGDIVLTLDADLQDDPKEIPRFLAAMAEGYDVVSGWKRVRHDPWHKTYPSRVFNWLVGAMTGVKLHDHNCGFKCYRRDVLREVRLYGEMHRFVPVLAADRGFRISEIPVEHRSRKFGQSKYGVRRFVKGFLDLLTVFFLTGFRNRPQHFTGTLGLISLGCGTLTMTYLTFMWGISRIAVFGMDPIHLSDTAMLYYAIGALLLGAQLVSLGFLAELITFHTSHQSDEFSISEQIGLESKSDEAEAARIPASWERHD